MPQTPIPFVSVIIPVYNDAERLKICLQALETQTYPKHQYEVIVVDNGSDTSIAPLIAEFPQTRASLATSQRGPAVARNKGIALARGEVIAFTDSDCVPALNWLERGIIALQNIPEGGLLGGRINIFFRNPNRPTNAELYDSIMHLNQQQYITQSHFAATANMFTDKRMFERVGGFDLNVGMSDDKEWGWRVAARGYPLIYADDVCIAHPAIYSFTQLRQKIQRIVRGNARLNRKNRSRIRIILNRDFLIGLLPPLKTMARHRLGILQQTQLLLMWCVLKGVEMKEIIRIMAEEEPREEPVPSVEVHRRKI